jgi:hypothetical protein
MGVAIIVRSGLLCAARAERTSAIYVLYYSFEMGSSGGPTLLFDIAAMGVHVHPD